MADKNFFFEIAQKKYHEPPTEVKPKGICSGCGRGVYPEEIKWGGAAQRGGLLYCPECMVVLRRGSHQTNGDEKNE